MKLGFTGTQQGMSAMQAKLLRSELQLYKPTEFHHGDCVGADAEAHEIVEAEFPNIKIVVHPPINPAKRAFKWGDEGRIAKDYLMRNRDIVNETDRLVAAPKGDTEELRSGTWATIRYAIKARKPYTILSRGA